MSCERGRAQTIGGDYTTSKRRRKRSILRMRYENASCFATGRSINQNDIEFPNNKL